MGLTAGNPEEISEHRHFVENNPPFGASPRTGERHIIPDAWAREGVDQSDVYDGADQPDAYNEDHNDGRSCQNRYGPIASSCFCHLPFLLSLAHISPYIVLLQPMGKGRLVDRCTAICAAAPPAGSSPISRGSFGLESVRRLMVVSLTGVACSAALSTNDGCTGVLRNP